MIETLESNVSADLRVMWQQTLADVQVLVIEGH